MRTTVRLDVELIEQLEAEARRQKVSLTRMLNRVVRAGLQAGAARRAPRRRYRERPHGPG